MIKIYAVYPDSRRMDLSDTNKCMAVFRLKNHAETYAMNMWGQFWKIKEIDVEDVVREVS